MEKWMKLKEVADWLNARRKQEEPPFVMHDVVRLLNAGKLSVCFEYEGLLGVYDASQPRFEDAEYRIRSLPERTFKFRGIVQSAESVDLRKDFTVTPSGEVEMQAFRTFEVSIREPWDTPPDNLPDGKVIRPFGPHGATATVDEVLVSFSDVAALVNETCAQTDTAPKDETYPDRSASKPARQSRGRRDGLTVAMESGYLAMLEKHGSAPTARALFEWLANDNDDTGMVEDATTDRLTWKKADGSFSDTTFPAFEKRMVGIRKRISSL